MNQYFFNRIYSLTIGYPGQENKARRFSGLRIMFDITKSELPGSNSCTIKINNLSDESRAFIKSGTMEREYRDGMTAILKAEYEEMGDVESLPVIFMGNIMTQSHDITKPEVETTLTCWDGGVNLKTAFFSMSYPIGASLTQIINDIVGVLALDVQAPIMSVLANNGMPDMTLTKGWAFHGTAADAMRKCCDVLGLRYSVQNNKVKMYPVKSKTGGAGSDGTPGFSAFLIGSPRRMNKTQAGCESLSFGGYDIDMLLCPKAEPGNTVKLAAASIPNSPVPLVVAEVHHIGDSHGDDWKSSVKGRIA
jgi:hypothetical protein